MRIYWTEDKDMKDRRSYVQILGRKEIRLELNGVLIFYLCDTDAVL